MNLRPTETSVDSQFVDRWSPRAYLSKPVSDADLRTLVEAARFAPSCFNDQPWLFKIARSESAVRRYRDGLVPANQEWARSAPVLIYLFGRKGFRRNGNPNAWSSFDCGSAWMSLALQARKLGLYAHAMAGFDAEKALELCGVSGSDYQPWAAITVGYRDEAASEGPTDRLPLDQLYTLE